VAAIAFLGASITTGVSQAHAAIFCGKTITKDTTLKKDLKDCPDDGLVAGAAGITINLNGHRVDGQGLTGTRGVEVSGYTNVVVRGGGGGRITHFDEGVALLNGATSRIRGVTIKKSHIGIEVNSCNGAKVRNNEISKSEVYGVSLAHADDVEISGNEIVGPDIHLFVTAGITVNAGDTANTLVKENVVRGGVFGDYGILVNGSAPGTKLKTNEVRGNNSRGIDVYDSATDTVVKMNTAIGNSSDGIIVEDDAGSGSRVLKNFARKNGDDGIELGHAGIEVGDNSADDNGDWGIIATQSIVDLGGNLASGNGQAAQCSGLTCG
jgi:parallel beta-helix repeat protein